jgi:hypothetical protein
MLAEGVELDVAEEDDLIVSFVEDRLEMPLRIILEAGHEFAIGAGDAVGRLQQSLAVGVFADGEEDLAHGAFEARDVDLGVG